MRFATLPSILLALGCAAGVAPDAPEPAAAPLIGAADGTDAADFDCHVTLRHAGRALEGGLPEVACEDGLCWLVFEADVQVSAEALAEDAQPGLLYQTDDGGWVEVAGEPTETAGLFRFRMAWRTVRDGLSAAGLAAARLPFIPFLRTTAGGRLFDHNRIADPLASYVLRGDEGFAIADDPAICPAPEAGSSARLVFADDWTESLEGTLRAGGEVVVEYDLDRLPQCIGDTYMGQRTWSTTLYARFGNGDAVVSEPVYACDDVRCDSRRTRPVSLSIPEDATEVELWFATAGRACATTWDSAFGANYRFPVRQPVGWVGAFSAKISRAGGAPCDGAAPVESVGYGTWARVRAITAHMCFRVWQEGVTDRDDAPADAVDVTLVCDWGDGVERRHGVSVDGREGNDLRYRLDLAGLDPFRPYRCPDVPTFLEGGYETARATCAVEANGARWGVGGEGESIALTFSDYPESYWRENNCAAD